MEGIIKKIRRLLRILFYSLPAGWRIRIAGKVSLLYYDGGYGDTFMAAAVAREIKKKYGTHIKVTVNCLKKEIIRNNPFIDFSSDRYNGIDLNYHHGPDCLRAEKSNSIIDIMCRRAGINNSENSVDIYFDEDERRYAREIISGIKRPVVSIQTTPGNFGRIRKSWPSEYWEQLCIKLARSGITAIQLGGYDDLRLESVSRSFCGAIDIRKSIALIKYSDLHAGVVSSLMHGAAAVGTGAVIIYGGFERYSAHKYKSIHPLESGISCAPCWKPDTIIDECDKELECMRKIKPEKVFAKIKYLLDKVYIKH